MSGQSALHCTAATGRTALNHHRLPLHLCDKQQDSLRVDLVRPHSIARGCVSARHEEDAELKPHVPLSYRHVFLPPPRGSNERSHHSALAHTHTRPPADGPSPRARSTQHSAGLRHIVLEATPHGIDPMPRGIPSWTALNGDLRSASTLKTTRGARRRTGRARPCAKASVAVQTNAPVARAALRCSQ